MTFSAKVVEVMIASPSDVMTEREIVRDVLAEWNAIEARPTETILLPRGWELDAGAELAGRPQGMINDHILDHADILVGLFWVRIGSPTGDAQSGTVEEIRRHHGAGKPTILYFSRKPLEPGNGNEHTWAFDGNDLVIIRSDGNIQNRFRYFADSDQFRRIDDPDAKGLPGQTIYRR